MGPKLTRRRFLAWGGASLLSSALLGGSRAQARPTTLRVGLVTPTKTGSLSIEAALYDFVGEAARRGALLAGEDLGAQAHALELTVLPASSPSAEAAFRAGQRLAATEEVAALIGGLGQGQAEALAAVARERELLFFNIGSPDDALRDESCNPYVFHVEASAAMYLDALVMGYAGLGHRRWFLIVDEASRGAALRSRALQAVARHGQGGEVVGSADVSVGQPVYQNEVAAIREAGADAVLLALEVHDQLAFFAQAEDAGLETPIAPFPDPVTQTRDYYAAIRFQAPRLGAGYRAALWETTLEAQGAATLNQRFTSRWGTPMDPSAWAAYQAVQMLFSAVQATGSLEAQALIAHLEAPTTRFAAQKEVAVSFRPWDHQLRQPLYLVKLDAEAPYGLKLSQQLELAHLAATLPLGLAAAAQPDALLDRLGDGAGAERCGA